MSNINLLPKEIKEEYGASKKNRIMLNVFIGILFISFSLVGVLVASRIYLNTKYEDAKNELKEKESSMEKYGTLEKDASDLDAKLKTARTVINKKILFSKAMSQIWESVPPKVYLMAVKMEENTLDRGEITGSAENKKEIANFIELLEDTEAFEYVDLENTAKTIDPFLSVEKENFTLSFTINLKDLNEKP